MTASPESSASVGQSLLPSDVPQLPRALPAFPSIYKYLTEAEADERRKEGRNASIKKIVVIAIIAAAAAVITFIMDDVQRQDEEQEGGDSPSLSLPFIPRHSDDDVDRGK